MDASTATAANSPLPIFQHANPPWHIFVSANGINGRPKLVRTIKKAGALICSDPKQANVILVDDNSDAGREFIREWGNDNDKVILKHTWVAACITASRPLGKDEEWGGFLAKDDGLPIVKEEIYPVEGPSKSVYTLHLMPHVDQLCVTRSPLPTPRITPFEATLSSSAPFADKPKGLETASQVPNETPPQLQNPIPYPFQSNGSFASQQMFQQAFMMHHAPYFAQMQQFASPNPMAFFQHPSGPSGSLSTYPVSAGMGSANLDNFNMNSNPPIANLNNSQTNMPSIQDPFYGLADNSQASSLPPSVRRKSPVVARSTPTSHTSSEQMRSFSPSTNRSASTSTRQLSHAVSSSSGTLFTSNDGQELSFFVQVDLNNRSQTIGLIKKNGGKIIPSNKIADYAILYSRSKTFQQLLESTQNAGRPAVSAAFVQDCVDKKRLLDPSSYGFEPDRSKSTTPRVKRKRVDSDEEKPKKAKVKATPSPSKRVAHGTPPTQDDSQPRSPTPPPEHTRVRRGENNYLYSDPEREYAERYVKMKHHSLGSWRAFLVADPFKTILERARKAAGIAYRKQIAREDLLTKEIETVATFFADGADGIDHDDVDQLWKQLAKQVKCQSTSSWSDFYEKHYTEIQKCYDTKVAKPLSQSA
ncbi:hypothetical protein H0H92_003128 [Tricholoma furcatifolium]|nr:hypothetical protein H0H92_003128 [Tricholoma furcatifolium]